MAIDKIGPINNYNKYEKINKKSSVEKTAKEDSVNISSEALNKSEASKIVEILNNTPDIREDVVKALKEKINDPNYLNSAINGEFADKLLKALDF